MCIDVWYWLEFLCVEVVWYDFDVCGIGVIVCC